MRALKANPFIKSDLITDASDLITIGNKAYRKDEAGTAESLAYASGNGKVDYYYTLSTKKRDNWTDDRTVEETNNLEWIKQGTGWFNREDSSVFQKFANGWKYNNDGNAGAQGVWRVKEILSDEPKANGLTRQTNTKTNSC